MHLRTLINVLPKLAGAAIAFAALNGEAAAQTVKIGIVNSNTGFLAQAGDQMEKGINLYLKTHEKDLPSGVKIELVRRDDAAAPEVGKRMAQELITREHVQVLLGFVGWRGGVEARNLSILPPAGYPGREALQAIRGASVATLWISSAPSAYTDEWAATLQTMRWLYQGRQGLTFDPGREFYAFFERDAATPRYRTPDYLFLPRLHTPGLPRVCEPFGGAIWAFADGCSDLSYIAGRMPFAPVQSSDSFLLYDLRALRKEAPHGS